MRSNQLGETSSDEQSSLNTSIEKTVLRVQTNLLYCQISGMRFTELKVSNGCRAFNEENLKSTKPAIALNDKGHKVQHCRNFTTATTCMQRIELHKRLYIQQETMNRICVYTRAEKKQEKKCAMHNRERRAVHSRELAHSGGSCRNEFCEVNAGQRYCSCLLVLASARRRRSMKLKRCVLDVAAGTGRAAFEQEWKCEKLIVRSFLVKPVPCISPASVSPWVSFSYDSSSESPAGLNSAATQMQQQRKFSSDANSAIGHSATQIQQLEFSDVTFSSWTFGDANSAAGDLATQTSSSPRNFIIQVSRHKSRFLMQETSPKKFRGNSHAYKQDFTL
ncbi:DNA-directed RNA polymerase IV subunit 1-like [Dorcoceras hygrometricum]|uniref:DNA-directed RNA polymerase IV subunit 1-like n=1 Tax=Dorcoceras hygrometricum TaxID=472368 RepID=A0A2Z7BUB6_9LAMI|nr:DNA-directed RNA polymerase IV subunit 1-like [Dorcoceras hygrometricum]